jgi:hypothetical protein
LQIEKQNNKGKSKMKITHEKLVKLFLDMGYQICEQYPSAKITVLVNAQGEFVTIRKSTRHDGRYCPNTNKIIP